MKLVLTAVILSTILACTPRINSSPGELIDFQDQNGDTKPRGGVDIGPNGPKVGVGPQLVFHKKTLFPIPGTQLLVSIAFGWKEKTLPNGLEINHNDGSKITITKTMIDGNSTPTLATLKEYLKAKHPDRNYSDIQINGSLGVSAEFTNSEGRVETDIYLISEFKDFIQIRMNLQHVGMVLANGQSVLSSIQLKRAGEPAALSMAKRVTLQSGVISKEVPLEFGQSSATSLKVSDTKKGSGYIVEIESLSEPVKFELIRAIGQGLFFGSGKIVPVESILILFQSNDRTQKRNEINVKVGGVYIVRTDNWPFEDLITKLLVESLEPGKSVTLKYQTLLAVPPGILIQRPYDRID